MITENKDALVYVHLYVSRYHYNSYLLSGIVNQVFTFPIQCDPFVGHTSPFNLLKQTCSLAVVQREGR